MPGSAIFGMGLGLENFPYKSQIFQFFPFGSKKSLQVRSKSTRVKGGPASYLLWVKSMLGLGQSPSLNLTTTNNALNKKCLSLIVYNICCNVKIET